METILIIDNEEAHRIIYRSQIEVLCPGRFHVLETDNSRDALQIIIKEKPVCIILDYMLNGENGMQIVHQFKRDIPHCPPILMVTCAMTRELRADVMALGAEDCLLKSSMTGEDLVDKINESIEHE
jgi:CheY-like chemotaxis protein